MREEVGCPADRSKVYRQIPAISFCRDGLTLALENYFSPGLALQVSLHLSEFRGYIKVQGAPRDHPKRKDVLPNYREGGQQSTSSWQTFRFCFHSKQPPPLRSGPSQGIFQPVASKTAPQIHVLFGLHGTIQLWQAINCGFSTPCQVGQGFVRLALWLSLSLPICFLHFLSQIMW